MNRARPFPPISWWRGLTQGQRAMIARMALGLGAILLLGAYLMAARGIRVNSDCASILMEADAVLKGNVFLRGWTLTNISFYLSDLPFYVLSMAFTGMDPRLMHAVPAGMFFLTVVAAVRLAAKRGPHGSWLGAALTFVLVAFPSQIMPNHVFVGPIHLGTLLLILVAYLGLDAHDRRPTARGPLLIFTGFLAAACFSDTLAVFVAALPIIAHAGFGLWRGDEDRHWNWRVLGATLTAVVASKVALMTVQHLGGFSTVEITPSFISLEAFGSNLLWTVKGLLLVFGAHFFGMAFTGEALAPLVHGAGMAGITCALWAVLKVWLKGQHRYDRLSEILALGMVLNVAEYLFSTMPSQEVTSRYLVPMAVFGAILAGRIVDPSLARKLRLAYVLPALAAFYVAAFVPLLSASPFSYSGQPVIGWLQEQGLHYGYGSFWSAATTTAHSKGKVKVRQVVVRDGKVKPYMWFADQAWYTQTPARFLVFDSFEDFGLNLESATRNFGPPARIHTDGIYTVLVWDKDITPLLAQ